MVRTFFRLAAVAAFVAGSSVQAQLATFDDLPGCTTDNTSGSLIANGYQGFNWSNFYVADGPNTAVAVGGPGYAAGTITPRCISLNASVRRPKFRPEVISSTTAGFSRRRSTTA